MMDWYVEQAYGVNCTDHCMQCDWWSFGVMLYEMLNGLRPAFSDDWETDYPSSLGSAKGLIKGLFVHEPGSRIPARGGADAIKKNAFFKGVSFTDHLKGKAKPVSKYNPARVMSGLSLHS